VKYNIGDWVLYKNPQEVLFMMKITGTSFKRCNGDLVPHRYYSGNCEEVEGDEDTPNFHFVRPDRSGRTFIINCLEGCLRGLSGVVI